MALTSQKTAGTGADDSSIGTEIWSNPGNITASDDTRASAGVVDISASHYLKATNFGFTIPTGATIVGILVEWERKSDADNAGDNAVRIVKGGTIGSTDKSSGTWPSTEAFKSYGGASDLWGETWTAEDVNATNFGAVISAVGDDFLGDNVYVDSCRITIYYTVIGSATLIFLTGDI